jgi:hypothetical protein
MSPGSPTIMNKYFGGFLQTLHKNAGPVPRLGKVYFYQILSNSSFNNHQIIQRYTDNENVT